MSKDEENSDSAPWEECLSDFRAHTAKLQQWSVIMSRGTQLEDVMSAPEVGDPKTDLGLNWEQNPPLAELIKRKDLPDPAKMSDQDVIDIMDTLYNLEAMFYENSTSIYGGILSCVYAYDLKLPEGNQALSAYVLGTFRAVSIAINIALDGSVRDEDEFPMPAIDPAAEISNDTVLTTLDVAIQGCKNEAVKARLEHRRQYLNLLQVMQKPNDEFAGLASAGALLKALKESNTAIKRAPAAKANAKVFREGCATWLTVPVPYALAPIVATEHADGVWLRLMDNFEEVLTFSDHKDLWSLLHAVEHFSSKKPYLFVRSYLTLLIAGPYTVEPAGGLVRLALDTLAEVHGAPLYRDFYFGNAAATEAVAAYRIQTLPEKNRNMLGPNTQQREAFRASTHRHFLEFFSSQIAVSIQMMIGMLLRNRGRVHRGMANLLPQLCNVQEAAFHFDAQTFCATNTKDPEWNRRSLVLTALMSELIYYAQDVYLSLNASLKLLTTAEYLPVLYTRANVSQLRLENLNALLVMDVPPVPKQRAIKGGGLLFAPVAATRQVCVHPINLITRFEICRATSSQMYAVLVQFIQHKFFDASLPSTAVTTPEMVFNSRFAVFGQIPRPPFRQYASCMKDFDAIAKQDFAGTLNHAANEMKALSDRIKQHPEANDAFITETNHAIKTTVVSLKMLAKAWEQAEGDAAAKAAAVKKQYSLNIELTDECVPLCTAKLL